jgi:thiamine kinase-like enzyme
MVLPNNMATDVEAILQRIPQWTGRSDLQVSRLSGGITNENYRIEVGGKRFVLRVGGAHTELLGIDRRHEWAANRAAAAAGLAPQALYFVEPEGYLLTRFIDGAGITPEAMRQPEGIQQAASVLQRIHNLAPFPGSFSPFAAVADYQRLAEAHGETRWPEDFGWLVAQMQAIQAAFERDLAFPAPCHNDLLNENFLRENGTGRLVVLDWEYAGMGDPYFDLANLAAQHGFDDAQDDLLLEAYFGGVTSHRLAHLKLMRCMSDFREAMWGRLQARISSLAFDFTGYAATYFDRLRAGLHDPRRTDWLNTLT